MKVLIIDHARAARVAASLGLAWVGGIVVCEAENGADGLDAARRERPDAILLDLDMPALDGPETLAALRRDPLTADIPVFLVAAQKSGRGAAPHSRAGARSVFYKPLRPERLAAEISALM